MTLFAAAADDPSVFQAVLDRYYDGPDEATLRLANAVMWATGRVYSNDGCDTMAAWQT